MSGFFKLNIKVFLVFMINVLAFEVKNQFFVFKIWIFVFWALGLWFMVGLLLVLIVGYGLGFR